MNGIPSFLIISKLSGNWFLDLMSPCIPLKQVFGKKWKKTTSENGCVEKVICIHTKPSIGIRTCFYGCRNMSLDNTLRIISAIDVMVLLILKFCIQYATWIINILNFENIISIELWSSVELMSLFIYSYPTSPVLSCGGEVTTVPQTILLTTTSNKQANAKTNKAFNIVLILYCQCK